MTTIAEINIPALFGNSGGAVNTGSPGVWAGSTGSEMCSLISFGPEVTQYVPANTVSITSTVINDEYNKNITSSDNSSPNQGAGFVDWNTYPEQASEPAQQAKVRDLTRFQKAYSFTRFQPVRIRLFRR